MNVGRRKVLWLRSHQQEAPKKRSQVRGEPQQSFLYSLLVLGADIAQQESSHSGSFRRYQSVVPGAGITCKSFPHVCASSWDSVGIFLHLYVVSPAGRLQGSLPSYVVAQDSKDWYLERERIIIFWGNFHQLFFPQHREVPGPGVESKQQLQRCQIFLTHCVRLRIEPMPSAVTWATTVGFLTQRATVGTPPPSLYGYFLFFGCSCCFNLFYCKT